MFPRLFFHLHLLHELRGLNVNKVLFNSPVASDGRRKLLARLITGRFTSRQEANLSSPRVVQIRNTCVMFELVLNSISQLKMDVLTGETV